MSLYIYEHITVLNHHSHCVHHNLHFLINTLAHSHILTLIYTETHFRFESQLILSQLLLSISLLQLLTITHLHLNYIHLSLTNH